MPKSKTDLVVKSTGDSASGHTNSDDQKTGEEPTANTQRDSNTTDAINEESNTPVNTGNLFNTSTSGKHFKPVLTPSLIVTDEFGRKNRSKSPVQVPASLICKLNSQYVRLQKLERISNYISAKRNSAQLNIIVTWRKDVEDIYALYLKERTLIEYGCPASFVTNFYFDADFHNVFHQHYYSIMFELSTLQQQWHTQHQASQILNIGETQPFQSSKLPAIKMPTFSGIYSEWPAFKELFIGMILNRTGLTDVAKLHYLRSSLKGSPLTWIEGFTLSGESLLPSWNTLVDRFENKRSLVNDHLDHLNDLSAAQPGIT